MGFGAAFFWALANCFVENGLVPSVEKKKKKKKKTQYLARVSRAVAHNQAYVQKKGKDLSMSSGPLVN
jgi:predicted TPR repeat methyltransferase